MEITGNMKLTEHLALPSEATLSQTSKLDGVRLSPHFSLREMTVTHGPMSKEAVALNFFSKKALILK